MRLQQYLNENIKQHLIDRGIVPYNPRYPVYIDKENNVAFFPLFNLSGKFVGYQRYNPDGIKGKNSYKVDNKNKKYYTYVSKENPEKNILHIALYGLHTLDKRKYVFIVEGIFFAGSFCAIFWLKQRLRATLGTLITKDLYKRKSFLIYITIFF